MWPAALPRTTPGPDPGAPDLAIERTFSSAHVQATNDSINDLHAHTARITRDGAQPYDYIRYADLTYNRLCELACRRQELGLSWREGYMYVGKLSH